MDRIRHLSGARVTFLRFLKVFKHFISIWSDENLFLFIENERNKTKKKKKKIKGTMYNCILLFVDNRFELAKFCNFVY